MIARAPARAVLADLMLELGGPGDVRAIRRWAPGQLRETEILALLDEVERPRREAFEADVLATIRDRRYPSADQIAYTRDVRAALAREAQRPVEQRRAETAIRISVHNERVGLKGQVLSGDQARWRRDMLTRLGWRKGRGDRWHAPESR